MMEYKNIKIDQWDKSKNMTISIIVKNQIIE